MLPGAKTGGASIGVAGAAWIAPDLTTITKGWMGYPVDPIALEDAVTTVVMSGWVGICGAVGLVGGLIANYYWRRAQERWGNGHQETPTPAVTQ